MNYNKHFLFVFTPKNQQTKRKRFLVSANQIHKYIGIDNTIGVFLKLENSLLYKNTYKFRKYGKLEVYSK